MTALPPRDIEDPAQRLDAAIARLLAGSDWSDLKPADADEAEEFEALMLIASALHEEAVRNPAPGSDD